MKVKLATFNHTTKKFHYKEEHVRFIKVETNDLILSVSIEGDNIRIHTDESMIIIPNVANSFEIGRKKNE